MSTTFLWCSKNTGNFFSQLTTHDARFLSPTRFPRGTLTHTYRNSLSLHHVDFIIGKLFRFFFFEFAVFWGVRRLRIQRKVGGGVDSEAPIEAESEVKEKNVKSQRILI